MGTQPRNRLLILLSAAHSLNHSFFWIASPLLLLITTDLNTSKTTIGIIGTIGSFIYGLGSILAGTLADKQNETTLIAISSILAGFSTIMFFFAQDITIYAGLFISMCIWTGLYHPASNALISKGYSGTTGEAMGIHGAGGTLGIVFTPILSLAIGLAYGWRMSFVVFGILAVIIAILLSRNRFQHPPSKTKAQIRDIFRISGMVPLLIFNFAVGLYMKSVELFLPTYLALGPLSILGSKTALDWAAISTSAMLLLGSLGQWLGGRQADAWGSKRVITTAAFTVLISFLILILTPSWLWFLVVIVFISLYGIAFFGHQPAFNSLAGYTTPEDRRGLMYGVLFFFSFGMGSISQTITGYLSDKIGITSAFYSLTLFAAAAFITSIFMRDTREKQTPKQQ